VVADPIRVSFTLGRVIETRSSSWLFASRNGHGGRAPVTLGRVSETRGSPCFS
jgi:hypothetical protein